MRERSVSGSLFDAFNYVFLAAFGLITVLPFIYILAGSLAEPREVLTKSFILFPTQFSLEAYRFVFSTNVIPRALMNTVLITVLGTAINLIFTSLMAYPLAKPEFRGRRAIMFMVVFSMLFTGGMIPTFLVVKAFGLLNTYWALMIPTAINAFNLIVLRNFFQQLPDGLEEAAKIDGCTELGILWRIVIPLSTPALATFGLFYAVAHWNTFFQAVLYIDKAEMWPIQVWLRQIVILSAGGFGDANFDSEVRIPPQTVKMAVIAVTAIPIMLVYPFLQKHFAKGVLLGSVKG